MVYFKIIRVNGRKSPLFASNSWFGIFFQVILPGHHYLSLNHTEAVCDKSEISKASITPTPSHCYIFGQILYYAPYIPR
ncbi:MAG: hypothetical protein ACI8QT_002189 [Halioglobus sp.]|jgi:hypothetical protein